MAIVWLLMQILFFYTFGIITELEAIRYINVAKYILSTGHYPSDNFLFYSVLIWLGVFCIKYSTGFGLIIVLQIILNGLSVLFFYKLILKLTSRSIIALVFTLIFLSMIYYHVYNVYLYTESIYFSLTVLFTYFLFFIPSLTFKNICLVILFIIVLSITRPTGFFFLPAAFVFLTFKFYYKKAWLITSVCLISCTVIFYLLLNFIMGSGGGLDFLLPYLDERVICGVPTITKPHDIRIPEELNPVQTLWYVFTHHTGLFLSLASRRFIAFFGMVRSHYSFFHNIYIVTIFFTVYILMLLSVKKMFTQLLPVALYCSAVIALFTITIILSCDEWHNRFIFGLWPLFLVMASGIFMRKTIEIDNAARTGN